MTKHLRTAAATALIVFLLTFTKEYTNLESAPQQKNAERIITIRGLLIHYDCLKPFPQPILGVNDLKRILVMGMPKCGTSSLKYLFQKSLGPRLGPAQVSHWMCGSKKHCGPCMHAAVAKNDDIGILKACGNFRVFTQMDFTEQMDGNGTCIFPQMDYMDRLYQDSPNATWILPFRNTTDWLQSVMNWGTNETNLGIRFERKCGWTEFTSENKTKIKQEEEVVQFICNHVKNVRQFVKDHPSLSLIEFDIYDEKAGEYLAETIPFLKASYWGQRNINK